MSVSHIVQADPHRRDRDFRQTAALMERAKQRKRNRRKWLEMAVTSIRKNDLDVAIARIQQARLEWPDGR